MSEEYKIISLNWGDGPEEQKVHLDFDGIAALSKFVADINNRNVFGEEGQPKIQLEDHCFADRYTTVDVSNISVKYSNARLVVDYESQTASVFAEVQQMFSSLVPWEFEEWMFKYRALGVHKRGYDKRTLSRIITCDVVFESGDRD